MSEMLARLTSFTIFNYLKEMSLSGHLFAEKQSTTTENWIYSRVKSKNFNRPDDSDRQALLFSEICKKIPNTNIIEQLFSVSF